MKYKYFLLLAGLFTCIYTLKAQTGPWAKYDDKMKGEALIREADGGYLKEVQSIVEGGGNVNWQMQPSGLTVLMAATSGGHIEVVKFLLKSGADPSIRDAYGRTALDRARQAGAKDLVNLLQTPGVNEPRVIPVNNPVTEITKPTKPTPVTNTVGSNVLDKISPAPWAVFGTYKVGEKVRFFNGSWHTGTVVEAGSPGSYATKYAAPGERKYLIGREGAPNWNDWIDWGKVTGLAYEKYWTNFFLGDWRIGEVMAANTRTDGIYQRDEYSFFGASEALSILPNNTYKWKTMSGKILTGTWNAAGDGAGIILNKAFQGLDWTIRNETNASEENIRSLQSARLTTAGKMSITAKRPL